MFDDGASFKIETAFARVAQAATASGRSPEPKAELLARNRKGNRSHGFLVLRVFGSGLKRPVRFTQSLMQAPPLRVTLANQRGGGSDGAAQHADRDGLDAGPHAKALLRLLDVEVRGGRLDADQDGDVGVGFAGRRPLQALDLARADCTGGELDMPKPSAVRQRSHTARAIASSAAQSARLSFSSCRVAIVTRPCRLPGPWIGTPNTSFQP